jgi:hypothetical protein
MDSVTFLKYHTNAVIVYHPYRQHCYTVGIHDSLSCDQHITTVHGQS